MRLTGLLLSACCLVLIPASAEAAERIDPATLFPADAILYAEAPYGLAKELSRYTKGSKLESVNPFERLSDNGPGFGFFGFLMIWAMLLSPEGLHEIGRAEGAAFAITRMHGLEPEMVGVIRTGDTNFVGFFLKITLLSMPMKRVAVIEGLPVWQTNDSFRRGARQAPGPDDPPEPKRNDDPETRTEVTLAYERGTFILGSNLASVRNVIRRLRGLDKSPSIAGVPTVQATADLRHLPGLYVFGNAKEAAVKLEKLLRQKDISDEAIIRLLPLLPFQSLDGIVGSLTLAEGDVSLQVRGFLSGKEPSPLADFLTAGTLRIDAFQLAPNDSMIALALQMPKQGERWPKVLRLADALFQGGFLSGDRPSLRVEKFEKNFPVRVGEGLVEQVERVSVLLPRWTSKDDVNPYPTVCIETADASVATSLESLLPILAARLKEKEVETPREEKEGDTVLKMLTKNSPVPVPLYYVAAGKRLWLGVNPKHLTVLLKTDEAVSITSVRRVRAALEGQLPAQVLGAFQWGELLSDSLGLEEPPPMPLPKKDKPKKADGEEDDEEPAPFVPTAEDLQLRRELALKLKTLSPLTARIHCDGRLLTVTLCQANLDAVTPTWIDYYLGDFLLSRMRVQRRFFNAVPAQAAPQPPPPPPVPEKELPEKNKAEQPAEAKKMPKDAAPDKKEADRPTPPKPDAIPPKSE